MSKHTLNAYWTGLPVYFQNDSLGECFMPNVLVGPQPTETKDKWDGVPYDDLIVTNPPASQLTITGEVLAAHSLSVPLIKCRAAEKSSDLVGIQSGRRSALVLASDGKWYRLKGCGDETERFRFSAVGTSSTEVELRGCMFENTVGRELFMTGLVQTALAPVGFCTANVSSACWVYSTGAEERFPLVKRCCGVFETRGDRRLGAHIMTGVELLLPALFQDNFDDGLIRQLFSEKRLSDPESWAATVPLCQVFEEGDMSGFADISNLELAIVGDRATIAPPLGLSEAETAAWVTLVGKLLDLGGPGKSLCIGAVYARLGAEAGMILRAMHDAGVSWGTFRDRLAYLHCNAHGNNYVLLPDDCEVSNGRWLAPLDFDMAFQEDHYIASPDVQPFSEIKTCEWKAMAFSLSGLIQGGAAVEVPEMPTKRLALLLCALRDTLVKSFLTAYESRDCVADHGRDEQFRALLGLASLRTFDVIA